MMKSLVALFLVMLLILPCGILRAAPAETNSFALPQYSQRVSMDFKGADLKDVLKVISKQIGVNFIVSKDAEAGSITVFLDNVPVEEALTQVLLANGLIYEFNESMNLIVIKPKSKDEEPLVTRVYQLKYASVDSSKIKTESGSTASLTAGLTPALSAKGKIVDDARTNSIIVTDLEKKFPDIERLLARLDVPVRQILIEMEILDVTKGTVDTLGSKIKLAASLNDTDKAAVFPWRSNKKTLLNLSNPAIVDKVSVAGTNGSISFANGALILDFLKNDSNTHTLARPRIVTADNISALIQITTNEVIGATTIQSTSTNTNDSTTLERYTTGVTLKVTPQVNPVTNEILMAVEPKAIDAGSDQNLVGITTHFKNPEERSVKVFVRVANGETAVIGGLLRRADNSVEDSVPFLSKLPVLGWLFKHKSTIKNERELIVFLTPHVLDGDQPMPQDVKNDFGRQLQLREQSLADPRAGLIETELNKYKSGR